MDAAVTEMVLEISPAIEHAVANVILFEYREEDTGFSSHSLIMPRKRWSDMGCPMEITVTIVPGDHLCREC